MAWTLIEHKSAPASDLFDFTALSLGAYRRVVLMLDDVKLGTDGAFLLLRLSTATTVHATGYAWRCMAHSTSGSDSDTNSTSDTSIRLIGGTISAWGIGNAAAESGACRIEIPALATGLGLNKLVLYDCVGIGTSGAGIRYVGAGMLAQTGTIDGIRILTSTGTLASGTATLYGLTTS